MPAEPRGNFNIGLLKSLHYFSASPLALLDITIALE